MILIIVVTNFYIVLIINVNVKPELNYVLNITALLLSRSFDVGLDIRGRMRT